MHFHLRYPKVLDIYFGRKIIIIFIFVVVFVVLLLVIVIVTLSLSSRQGARGYRYR